MRPFPKLHDLLVARVVVGTVLLTWAVLTGLDMVLAMVDELRSVGQGSYRVFDAVTYVAHTLPRRAYMMFPTAAVIGSLMGLGQLAASSELTALRALGVSRKRLSVSVALPLLVLTGLMMVNAETLGPWAQRSADMMKSAARSNDMIVAQYSGLWAREGETFLNAQAGRERSEGGDTWLELNDVRLFEFDADGRLASVAHAKIAEHRTSGWLLRGVRRTYFDERAVAQADVDEERWDSSLDAAALAANASNIWRPRYMSSAELKEGIDYRKRNQLDASEFEEYYWGHWFYPLNVLALCLAAIPFAFGSLRSGGLGRRLFIGVVFALGFWLLQTQVVKLAAVYSFDYRIAYLVPPLIMLTVSWLLFRKRSG
ncbi:LPS export ABC transporter permease LptG [Luteimonas sp. M1R5S18]|uniref:LPS export ABC transporter permease LptG n=1 Tax=Luteimonas rhizosphaericola TaxID=3042024 RepID=A0ABT6JHZ5_9GAMM|nr:LPS export ABC transporter permease LptG [Luteimonas rhizosphaericola]MDH5830300.1 LPS export ABC transporter permease LptG [Luteimonas rhizosphaericola]